MTTSGDSRWIVTQFDEPTGGDTQCVIVAAATPEQAAARAVLGLEGEERLECVFVAPWG